MQPNNRNGKEGQATSDFLFSYGLAILIIVLIAAGLFALGIFDASNFVGTKSAGFSGVAVKGWSMGSSGRFTLQLTNHVGQRLNITNVNITVGAASASVNSAVGILPIGSDTPVLSTNAAAFGERTEGSGYIADVVINYVDMNTGFASSSKGTLTGRVVSGPSSACPSPTASPAAGAYTSAQSITLSAGACSAIHYTLDGSTPTNASPAYSGPIPAPLDANTTIKAFSSGSGYTDSAMFSGTYTITHALSTPVASPPAGAYNSSQNITLAAENGSTIYYTANGSTPTGSSSVYSSPINVPAGANTTIKAYSAKSGYGDSPIFTGTYLIASPPSPQPNGSVVLQMDFDADVGAIAVDSSIYGNNGTIVNATHASGISGSALNFTGAGYVSIPNSASLNIPRNITLEAWVKWNVDPYAYYLSNPGTMGWAQILNKNVDNEWQLQHSTNNTRFEFALRAFNGTNTVRKYIQSTTIVQQGVWYHIAGTYDGQYMKLYVNGQNENQVSMIGNISVSSSPVNIGRRFGGSYNDRYFNGLIEGVKVHNRSLDASEIS